MRVSTLAHAAKLLIIIFPSAIYVPCVDAVNLDACGARLLAQRNAAQNTTNTTVSPSTLRISYEECLAECGPGLGDVNWQGFSQNFGAWFLPWLSLMFQIPFGAERPLDDIVSFFITGWITEEVLNLKYPNSHHIATALAAFHHIPIQMKYNAPLLHSLVVLPQNDKFWSRLASANMTRPWAIPLVMNYVFVVFSLLLATADSISAHPGDIGYSIAATWTFLFPLIIGWIYVGYEPEPSHLRNLLAAANKNVWVAAKQGPPKRMKCPKAIEFAKAKDGDMTIDDLDAEASDVDSEAEDAGTEAAVVQSEADAVELETGGIELEVRDVDPGASRDAGVEVGSVDPQVSNADLEAGNVGAEDSDLNAEDSGVDPCRSDELKPVPVFNYSRAFVTPMNARVVLRLLKYAAKNAERETPADNSVDAEGVPVWAPNEKGAISPLNRVGTSAEVVKYCTRVIPNLGSVAQSEIQSPGPGKANTNTNTTYGYALVDPGRMVSSRWPPGIWTRVAAASLLSLGLQWGTTGAAVYIHYIAPPPGLGCRAFSFLMYGVGATLSFSLFLTSSILAHKSRPLTGHAPPPPRLRNFLDTGATVCRRSGKCVAFLSAIGILFVCFLQVTGAFNNCYCNSTTFGKGRRPVVFTGITFVPDSNLILHWISGLGIAFLFATLFGFSLYAELPSRRRK